MKTLIAQILTGLLLISSVLMPAQAFAACPSGSSAKAQVLQGIHATGSDCKDKGVSNFVQAIVNIMSIIVGIAAIVMIISSGFKFITSGGSAERVANAKGTLIWALVGIVIAALAQFLVHFVLTQASKA